MRELAPSAEPLRWYWAEQENPDLDEYVCQQDWRARYSTEMETQKALIDDLRCRHKAGGTLSLLSKGSIHPR